MNNFRRRTLNKSGVNVDPTTGRGFVDGYEFVDLGLPSGLLWATCNVGASKETDYGNYYKYGYGSETYYYDPQKDGSDTYYDDTEDPLDSEYDTATQVMGEEWRMPTKNECQELINNTTYSFGSDGCWLKSKINPNAYVYFPFAGNYFYGDIDVPPNHSNVWSSSFKDVRSAYCFYFNDGGQHIVFNGGRFSGLSVRGVHAAV